MLGGWGGWQSHCLMLCLSFSVLMVLEGFRVGDAWARGPESNLMTALMCSLIDICDFMGPGLGGGGAEHQ